ncbi:MAG: 4-vinyl reductase [Chloroflexi bacterium]|nr:4-vinyl reductase [Chloroflexota bacterium]
MGRIVLLAMEEVMGRNGVNAVLNLSRLNHLINNYPPNNFDMQFTFDEMGTLQKALDDMYGPRGGRGLALRAGRACFKYGVKEFGPVLGIADLAFRLLPLTMKLKVGANVFADSFNKFSDQKVSLSEEPDRLLWKIERCPVCWGRKCESPCCFLAVGILQESLFWVSGGKNFQVEEIACLARGDEACTVAIYKQPLD